jgi:hypothetical protein
MHVVQKLFEVRPKQYSLPYVYGWSALNDSSASDQAQLSESDPFERA